MTLKNFFAVFVLILYPLIHGASREFSFTSKGPEAYGIFDFGNVHFRNDFSGARLTKVNRINDSTFQLLIEPENSPVNKSGWYAFKTWSDTKLNLTLVLKYSYGEHRYTPKVSSNGRHWETLSLQSEEKTRNDETRFRVSVTSDTLWVSAQEIVTSQHIWDWADSLDASHPDVEKKIIGQSIEGRPIVALRIGSNEPRPVLVILARQHPPEVTGQFAMKAFIEQLLTNSESSRVFLQSYATILIPLINPDGVEHGNWRHNMAGVDLNRDWLAFNQPETLSVKDYLEGQVAQGDSIVFALDFHSTKTDVLYVVTDEEKSLTKTWIDALHLALPEAIINTSFHGTDSATSKNWMYKRFGAEAVTYEVGDNTDRVFLKHLGKIAALCLVKELMNRQTSGK